MSSGSVLFAFLGFYYHDKIEKIIDGENWSYINSYAEINSAQSLSCFGRKDLCICTKEGFKVYNNNIVSSQKDVTITDFLYDSNGIYSVLYVTDSKSFYLITGGIAINSIIFLHFKTLFLS